VLVNLNGQHALEAIDPALYERQDDATSLPGKPALIFHHSAQVALDDLMGVLGCMSRMKAKSVSVMGSVSLSKDGKSQVFRDMKHAFGHDFMRRCDHLWLSPAQPVQFAAGNRAMCLCFICIFSLSCRTGP
jgi:hypothetical protein